MFETKNDILVNVLVEEDKDIHICQNSDHKTDHEINLMLISEDDRWHYTAIKSLSRLLTSRHSKRHGQQYFCTNCLQGFKLELSRDEHYDYCIDSETVRVEMPKKGSTVKFYDGQNQFRAPFMMYADFEAILNPIQRPSPDPGEPYIKEVNQHIPSGFCVYGKFTYGEVENPLRLYRGKDCVEKFCNHIKEEAKWLYHMFPEKPMDPLTNGQWKRYKIVSKCHICYKPFNDKDPKVRDHCHYTGKYREPDHMLCNLRYKIPSYIPVVFHNLSRYDAHLFIRELGKKSKDIGVIAKNKEDYITFSVDVAADKYVHKEGNEKDKTIEHRFIDSFKFMVSSLDSLTNNLVKGGRKLMGFEDYSEEQYKLLVRKGIYPYEYMSSWDKFAESQLSPKTAFYSNLNMSNISDDDYEHVQKVWQAFKIKNLGEYHYLYLKPDVILLANIFEAFRNTCLEHYKLDPAHFHTSPGLAWKACLKKIGVKLELLADPNMLLMFGCGIRRSIAQVVHRYAKANNKYMGNKFNPREESRFLQYLDANNFYCWAMSQSLPTSRFRWVNIEPNEIDKLERHTDKGYLLEVDVKYPKELHNSHNNLPFMCEKMKINGVEKLVLNLYDKKNYVIHI